MFRTHSAQKPGTEQSWVHVLAPWDVQLRLVCALGEIPSTSHHSIEKTDIEMML